MSAARASEYDLTIASHLVVERFLLSQGYTSSAAQLRADAQATGLSLPPLRDDALELRTLVETYRSSVRAEEQRRAAEELNSTHSVRSVVDPLTLSLPGPATLPFALARTYDTIHASNILSITRLALPRRTFDTATARYANTLQECLVTTGADRRVVFTDAQTGEVEEILDGAHAAAVLSVVQDPQDARCIVTASMDASIVVWDLLTRKPIQTLKHHTKFVVRLAVSATGEYMASIGYDKKLVVYRRVHHTRFSTTSVDGEEEDQGELEGGRYEKAFEMETRHNPEAILFVRAAAAPESCEPTSSSAPAVGEVTIRAARRQRTWLCFTVRHDSFVHYLALPLTADSSLDTDDLADTLASTSLSSARTPDWSVESFNTNPVASDLHVSYSLLSLSLHASGLYICIQTGDHSSSSSSRLLLLQPLSGVRAATVWTGLETGTFGTPRHSWLPSGRACWLNSEDGVLRLVDLGGKTRATVLAHGLVAPDQVAASWTRGGNPVIKDVVALDEHTLASCGFDHTIRITTIDPALLC
ncbi:uncharacterized protein PAN0_014c4872 [Moesziomyces antarcticus]|uniref:Uncharacterized protein n=2 Tax=Pseudozyma antarctica TaxID=84753 RepID=A0A081CJ03_PSEA2|nr:uncharacterized protein PAN0_014c4872 [Moesziomyces antarcticus]GAK66649.1 conserved hypothetical protein [Moesziomyces antarcticus]SPO47698.1 uncharacterized protein PSANT_05386 [Moesziomyces antarcticus]